MAESAPPTTAGEVAEPPYVSAFRPLYDDLVRRPPTVSEAVARAIAYEDERNLAVPRVYVSMAITSAGWRRDHSLPLDEAIARNGRLAAYVLAGLARHAAPRTHPTEVMLPTELGKVRGWADSDYLLFCFAWLGGLSASATRWLESQLSEPIYAPIRRAADDRSRSNDERWPHYRLLAEALLTNLALAEARPDGKRADGSQFLLQLVDTGQSLGCRAETIYADVRTLDRLSPTFADDLSGPLGEELNAVRSVGARVGVARKPVEIVPVLVR